MIRDFIGRLMDSPRHTHTLGVAGYLVMSADFAQISPAVGALHRYILSAVFGSQDNYVGRI